MSKKLTPKNPTGVPYVYYNWGPCLIRIKISEAFQQKLLKEAYASRKESLSMNKK